MGGPEFTTQYNTYFTIRNIVIDTLIEKIKDLGHDNISINYINNYAVIADGYNVTILNLNNIITSVSDDIITITNNTIYPNPTSSVANIEFALFKDEQTNITIYDNNSNLINTIYSGLLNVGLNTLTWNTNNVASGIYYCNINIDNKISTIKIIVNK